MVKVLSVSPVMTPIWGVFSKLRGPEGSVYTKRLQLWAKTRTYYLNDPTRRDPLELENHIIQGMMLNQNGELIPVTTEFDIFVGYSETEVPDMKEWAPWLSFCRRRERKIWTENGLDEEDADAEIKAPRSSEIFKRLAKKYHPDGGGDGKVMQDLNMLWQAVQSELAKK